MEGYYFHYGRVLVSKWKGTTFKMKDYKELYKKEL
nr:MAG TPA: hypothetical protein [Caudoviricetes sp.]